LSPQSGGIYVETIRIGPHSPFSNIAVTRGLYVSTVVTNLLSEFLYEMAVPPYGLPIKMSEVLKVFKYDLNTLTNRLCVFNYFFKYFTKRYNASNDEDSEQNNEAPSFASLTDLIRSRPLSLPDDSEDADLV